MKHLTVAAALVLALASAGCSSGDGETDTAAPAPAESSAEAQPSTAAPSAAASAAAGGGENVLTGIVGSKSNPDAFEISLTDSSGQKVSSLPAGEYTINVDDLSKIHNFHITGGDVDEGTTVPETGAKTFTVTFAAGDYSVKCDPHPKMVQDFKVT